MNDATLRELITFSRDGEWGSAEPVTGATRMRVIRGTDFDAVRVGDFSDVPERWIDATQAQRKRLQPDDILIETAGGSHDRITGRTVLIRESEIDGLPVTCASFSRIVRVDRAKILPQYLFWFLQNDHRNGDMHLYHLQHTGVARFQFTEYARRTLVRIPAPHVQASIANLLGTLESKIETNHRTNRRLSALASALFRSWFIDFDPVVAKRDGIAPIGIPAEAIDLFPSRFQDSELGPIPQGWRVVPLDSVADFLNGLALQRYPPSDAEVLPVIKIAELRAGTIAGAALCGGVPSEYVIDDGDVIFSWSGTLMVDVWCGGRGALNQHLFKVTSRDVPKWFYLAWLNEHLPEFQAIAADKATTMGHIRRFHLTEAKVVVPPDTVLKAMTDIQGPLLDQIIHNRLESRRLVELRDALLGPLLSGELTIKFAENAIEAAV